MSNKQRKFVLRYIQNGLNAKQAAISAGYCPVYYNAPIYRIQRKVDDVIEYLIAKNNIINCIVKPEWIFTEYKKLYQNTNSTLLKSQILQKLSKIMNMQKPETQVNINNNIPQQSVIIKFEE